MFYKIKRAYEIDLDKLKYLNVFKLGSLIFITISFINSDGKFIRLKFNYNSVFLGLSLDKQRKNSHIITNKLLNIEKILNRGNF